jgi:hypothetical protein
MGSRLSLSLVAMILTLGQTAPASAQGVGQTSTTTGWTPIPAAHSGEERTAREKEVRRIVEEDFNSRNAQLPMLADSEMSQQCEDCVSPADFISQNLTVNLGGAGRLTLYGYGRGDLILTTSRLNNAVVPFFVLAEDPTNLTPAGVPIRENDGQFNANVRLTRLGLDYDGPHAEHLANARLSANIEIDFETLIGITSESRAIPRIRLGYGKMTWGELSILAGQDWDVIAPLLPMINDDSLMWLAGNLGDRRPMLKTTWNHQLADGDWLTIVTAISSGGAVDRQDLDGNGIKDGEDSGYPALQTRIGYAVPNYACEQSAEFGMWGFASFESVEVPIGGNDEFSSRGLGIDWSLPLVSMVTWRGEAWYGRNLSDWRGGIGQGINTATGEEIESHGGWTELQFQMKPWWKLALGTTIDNPVDTDLIGSATTRSRNRTWYVGNRLSLGGGLNIAFNVEFWNTQYLTLDEGDAVRFKTWLSQRF